MMCMHVPRSVTKPALMVQGVASCSVYISNQRTKYAFASKQTLLTEASWFMQDFKLATRKIAYTSQVGTTFRVEAPGPDFTVLILLA